MAPAHSHEALIVVLIVRFPDAFSGTRPLEQGKSRINDERRENHHRKPEWPITVAPPCERQHRCEETYRDRPGIAHEESCGRKIERQKRGAGGCHNGALDQQSVIAAHPGSGSQKRKTEYRHSPCKPVGAIHEVVEICHPHDAHDDRCHKRERQTRKCPVCEPGGGCKLDAQTDRNRQAASVVEMREHDENGGGKHDHERGLQDREAGENARHHGDAAHARHRTNV